MMDNAAMQDRLLDLFEVHDVPLDRDEDWLVTDDDFPAVRARWHECVGAAPGRLDVDIVLSEERCIEESFAGRGEGDAACLDALASFEHAALPALLAACWYVTDERTLQLESRDIGLNTWDIFIGRPARHGAEFVFPEGLESGLVEALRQPMPSPLLHWLRWVVQRRSTGEIDIEVLLDNAPWEPGRQALTALDWPVADGAYGAHGLLLLDVRDY